MSSEASIVVTGASGFLGRAVMRRLAAAGLPARAATRRDGGYAALAAPPGAVLIHLAEPRDIGAAERAGAAHLAAVTDTLSRLLEKPWAHIVYASSAAVYGDASDAPHRSEEVPAPMGIYGRAKRACEEMALTAGGTVLRLANLYGPGMAVDNVLSDILKQVPGKGPLRVRDLAPVRDFLWIDDAAEAFALAATVRAQGVLNVGSGDSVAVADLARLILGLAGEAERPLAETAPVGRDSALRLDIAETARILGWRPRTPLATGLEKLLRDAAIPPIPTPDPKRVRVPS